MHPPLSYSHHTQLQRLMVLRSVAILAQLLVLYIAWQVLQLSLNWLAMLLVVASLAIFNSYTWLRLRHAQVIGEKEIFVQLCTDVLALSILLYYSGGSTNPFISLFLLPQVITATTLSSRYTWAMAGFTTLCYAILIAFYIPLPVSHHGHSAFDTHMLGMQLGFVISALVIAYFVFKMSQAVHQRDEMLARIREENLRNERIVALGTQAAGAAHELGTPLATMAVVIGELKHDTQVDEVELQENLDILDEQVRACRRILDKILSNVQANQQLTPQAAKTFMQELLSEWQLLRPTALYEYQSDIESNDAPYLQTDTMLRTAFMNLLNNAADTSSQPIHIHAYATTTQFVLEIHDQGKGISPEVARQLGHAFFTTKTEGHGVGLLLANATIEKLGGTVHLFNREQAGATTKITLPILAQA